MSKTKTYLDSNVLISAFQGTDDEKLEKFRQIRDLIEARIKSWLLEQNITVQ